MLTNEARRAAVSGMQRFNLKKKKPMAGVEPWGKRKAKKRICQGPDVRSFSGVAPYCAPLFRVPGIYLRPHADLRFRANTVGVISEDLLPTNSAK